MTLSVQCNVHTTWRHKVKVHAHYRTLHVPSYTNTQKTVFQVGGPEVRHLLKDEECCGSGGVYAALVLVAWVSSCSVVLTLDGI